MESSERMRFYAIIAVLVAQLGGEVTISEQQIANAPEGTVSMTPTGMVIKAEVKA